jgi:hypothetical protein
VGAPGPNLHIVQEVSDNQFKIAGGTPESKVSWQVTGVCVDVGGRDEADRVAVEEEKPAEERGYYLRPVLYGEPAERGIVNGHAMESTGS